MFDAFHKQIMMLMTDRFLFKTDPDLLVDKKCLCLLTVFACMEYCLTGIINIVLEEAEPGLELKK